MSRTEELDRMVDFITHLQELEGRFTEIVGNLRGLAINDVLTTETATFDANGIIGRDYSVPYASVAIGNISSGDVTVASGSAATSVPTAGTGVAVVPAGGAAAVNLTGHEITFYGPAGGRISFSVFTKPQGPAFAGGGQGSSTGTATQAADVAAVAGGAVMLAANPARKAAVIQNTGAAAIRVGVAGSVGTARGFQLAAGASFRLEEPYIPTGALWVYRDATAAADSTATAMEIS